MAHTLLLIGDSYTNTDLYYVTHFLQGDPFAYLQLGDRPKEASAEALTLLWQAAPEDSKWAKPRCGSG